MTTRQRAAGAVIALIGALGVTASSYLDWYGGRDATDIPLERLFQTDSVGAPSSYWNSMALALAVVGLLGVVGAVLLSRFVLILAWLIGAATLVLWIVMSVNDDSLSVSAGDIQAGAWVCGVALLVLLAGIIGMGGGARRVRDETPAQAEPVPPPEV
ncbi:hypothetical protein [Jiangella anatolica]|uniref:Uncharacterized protein n=1 Tax=Jiangella anatolica TaxID=2670374 RepID=A0A2W2BLC3_9ACTN|nr:hypothetical protein [Jiangella anatolica]PZF81078.1 hypothetical protein C1I92_22915 [Jiangella anatolica]